MISGKWQVGEKWVFFTMAAMPRAIRSAHTSRARGSRGIAAHEELIALLQDDSFGIRNRIA
jgi:hypothetical protein